MGVDTYDESDPVILKYGSGVTRTNDAGKPDYTLLYWEGIDRWAAHMTKAVPTHGHNNWRKAHTAEDLLRFRQSFWRHARQWERGEDDEDHYAAMLYNASGVELVKTVQGLLAFTDVPQRGWEL